MCSRPALEKQAAMLAPSREALPIGTIEDAIPASMFGGEKIANMLGRPELDGFVSEGLIESARLRF